MAVLKALNTALSFVLEIAMLAAFFLWGYHAIPTPWLRWVLAMALPLVVGILWGLFLAPRARRRAGSAVGVAGSLGLFCLAALALFLVGRPGLGTAMVALAAINRALVVIWKQW